MIYILDILSVAILLAFAYFAFLIANRMLVNNRYDKKFEIDTTGTRSWGRGSLYNRTESTPYMALNSFARKYTMNPNDSLVDFGSGRSRVTVYMHNRFKIPVTGIELNDLTYDEAVANINSYLSKYGSVNKSLRIEKEYAEKYKIGIDQNKFFFFNPFDVSIFKKVVSNIIESSKEHNKEVEIILYYPLSSYKDFLRDETSFILDDEIKTSGAIGLREKFLTYRLVP